MKTGVEGKDAERDSKVKEIDSFKREIQKKNKDIKEKEMIINILTETIESNEKLYRFRGKL